MSTCSNCGAKVQFRVIGGRTVPLGCRCDTDREFYFSREERARRTWCPKCNAECYYVEHNGGSVWLDALGPPWPKHPCFDENARILLRERATPPQEPKREFAGQTVDEIGRIMNDNLRCDLGQRFMLVSFPEVVREFYVSPEFWEASPQPATGDSIGYWFGDSWILRADGVRFRCRSVNLHLCGRCKMRFLNWQSHRERCKALKR